MSLGSPGGVSGGVTAVCWPPGSAPQRRERLSLGGRGGEGGRAGMGKNPSGARRSKRRRVAGSIAAAAKLEHGDQRLPQLPGNCRFQTRRNLLLPLSLPPALAHPSSRAPPPPAARRPARCRHRPGAWERAPALDSCAGDWPPAGRGWTLTENENHQLVGGSGGGGH